MNLDLSGKTVFVTGGSGFIGGRLIESLVMDYGARVKAVVNTTFSGALRMARFPVEFVHKSITDVSAMTEATRDCDVIFHLAYGKTGDKNLDRKITVDSTAALIKAAITNQVSRFVYTGTAAVYYKHGDGLIDETMPCTKWGWHYSDQKLDAEEILLKAHRKQGLPASIIQVAGAYGPWGGTFTLTPLNQLKTGRVVLSGMGEGISNATYVDDTVQGLLLAATHKAAIGERFLIKGPGEITRRKLYEAYCQMLGDGEIVLMTSAQIKRELHQKSRETLAKLTPTALNALSQDSELRSVVGASPIAPAVRKVIPLLRRRSLNEAESSTNVAVIPAKAPKPLIFPPKFYADYQASKISFSTKKAERLLGYRPSFDLEKGMAMTEKWARWARLIA